MKSTGGRFFSAAYSKPVARKCDLSGRQTFRMTAVRKTTSQDGNYQEDSAQEAATGKCVRMTMSGRPTESGLKE